MTDKEFNEIIMQLSSASGVILGCSHLTEESRLKDMLEAVSNDIDDVAFKLINDRNGDPITSKEQ